MPDLETVDHNVFAACLNEPFELHAGDVAVTLELVEVTARSEAGPPGASRVPFSLLFTGPGETPLDQGLYRLDNAALGLLEIFLVPVAQTEQGMQYEAVFN